MTALDTSLHALKHPLNLASIGLLLFNDHVLKTAAPSPLSGKLSDLAGLFFFPFLLAALLSPLLDWRRVRSRRVAGLAFGLTGLCFTLVKTWPWANALTVAALEGLLGLPVQIVRDPTDLLALLVLWPAWRLWVRMEQTPPVSKQSPGKAAYLALGLASLAALATSPEELATIVRLVVFEQSVYAGIKDQSQIARSDDGGQSWIAVQSPDVPQKVHQQLETRVELPLTVCDPQNAQICYRITGGEQVQGSHDGGQSWQVVWQVPSGRRKFMERFVDKQMLSTRKLDLTLNDLVLLPQEKGTTLIAAVGNEGVLVRNVDGDWQRYGVLTATPTPYTNTDSWYLEWLLLREHSIFMVATFLAGWVLCILGWDTIFSRLPLPPERSSKWAVRPANWGVVIAILTCVLGFLIFFSIISPIILAMIPMFTGATLSWRRVESIAPRPGMVRAAWRVFWLGVTGMFPLAWLAFPLWAAGTIPAYETALALSVCVGITSFATSMFCVKRLCLAATIPVETNILNEGEPT